MSGLLESLTSASNALSAQRLGLDVTGQNMANINTEGYSRRMLMLANLPPTDALSAGRGVEILGVRALRDRLVEARIRREEQSASHDDAVVESLGTVEAGLGLPGEGLDARLTAFFNAFSRLADDASSAVARDGAVQQGTFLARSFNETSARLTEVQRATDLSIRAAVGEINQLTDELAGLNLQIEAGGFDVEALRDRQGVVLGRLSELADIAVLEREDGGVDVTTASGRPLVIAKNAYPLTLSGGSQTQILSGDADITAEITGGRVGGWLHVRDTMIPSYAARLDQLAYDVAGAVNAIHLTGFDANGDPGGNFFEPLATVAGAANAIALNAALAADPRLVAASATGASGDNQTARAIAALRDGQLTGGGTMTANEYWSELVYLVGSDAAGAVASSQNHTEIQQQLQRMRDQASGVSLDEEAAHLMRYQRAYEASARYFTTIVDTLDVLMDMVRR